MTEQPGEVIPEQPVQKAPTQAAKGSDIYPIKEVFEEEDYESPSGTYKQQVSYRASHNGVVEDSHNEDNLTDRQAAENGIRDSVGEEDDPYQQTKRRSTKSVDHTRANYQRKSEEGVKRTVRQSPAGLKKKVNLDVFSMASGGRHIKKKQGGTLFGRG